MQAQREMADMLRAELPSSMSVNDGEPFLTALHELIHGTYPRVRHAQHARADAARPNPAIQEGFIELGAVQHAAEFFRQLAVGDHERTSWPSRTGTPRIRLAGIVLNPVSRQATPGAAGLGGKADRGGPDPLGQSRSPPDLIDPRYDYRCPA